jgi:hypothetical protein
MYDLDKAKEEFLKNTPDLKKYEVA